MYLLYVDDSGDIDDPNLTHFVLGGFAIFERQTYWLSKELDAIAERFDAADPHSIELHGNPMVQGNRGWKRFPRADRNLAISDAISAFKRTHPKNKIFSVVMEKGSVEGDDPVEFAFEQLCNRFDRYLTRLHREGDTQRGLLIMDKTGYERRFQGLARDFSSTGHRWGTLRNVAEVPMFVDSRASRLIQLADLMSYSIFRHFEKSDSENYNLLSSRFDAEGTQVHGLVHWRRR
ncbi:DUF3800 domain-containing protein [Pelagibacterium halotolerans]|uniref:DUF3800 domain-containing protein n=1 Tax=Pelagibacterium halotolerans TaxID=531813 RepID=UPI00384FEE40